MRLTQPINFALAILAAMLIAGCSSTRSETYEVTVHNALDGPAMIFLTKDGPPLQEGWWSPEDIAVLYGKVNDDLSRMVIKAGGIAESGKMTAKLAPGAHAILTIYEGVHELPELLAIHRGSADRTDLRLAPGKTEVTIKKTNDVLTTDRVHTP